MRLDLVDHAELFERAPFGYVVTAPDGRIELVNGTFLDWTGYAVEDLVGVRDFQGLLGESHEPLPDDLHSPVHVLQGRLREIAVDLRCVDGSLLPVLVSCTVDDQVRIAVMDARARRLFEDGVQRTQRRLERLQRITGAFAAALTSAEVSAAALDEIVDGIKADLGVVAILDPVGELRVLGERTTDPDRSAWDDLRAVAGVEIAHVLAHGHSAFLDPTDAGPFRPAGTTSLSRVALLPLAADDITIGVLALGSNELPAFDQDQRGFLIAFAELCAQALDRAKLHDAAEVTTARMAMLVETTRVLDEVLTFRQRAQLLVDMLVPALADYATVEVPALGPAPVAWAHRDPSLARTLLELRTEVAISAEQPHSMAAARDSGRPQILSDIPASMYEAYGLDPDQLERLRRLAPSSYVGLPLIDRGRVVGSLMLVSSTSGRRFETSDMQFFADLSGRAALALENARLYEHEKTVARELQARLITTVFPDDPRAGLSAFYRAGAEMIEVGGDWYDAFMVSEDRLGLVVGDVVGRGVQAAAVMGQLRTALRAYASEGFGATGTLGRLDRFAESIDGALGATVAYAELDLITGVLRYACAGHPPPIVCSPDGGSVAAWGGRSPVLGVAPRRAKDEASLELGEGMSLLLYTDGLVESRQRPVGEGIDDLVRHISRHAGGFAALPLDQLADEMIGGQSEIDDVCVLRVTRRGSSPLTPG